METNIGNREIKFRAWDLDHEVMLELPGMPDYLRGEVISVVIENGVEACPPNSGSTDNYKVMQYTGLKDKNGIEIYEGDIVEIQIEDFKMKHIIEYVPSLMAWSLSAHLISNQILQTENAEFLVIGNVFENGN